ncbi:hypothetical protein [Ruegeria meonggei]
MRCWTYDQEARHSPGR